MKWDLSKATSTWLDAPFGRILTVFLALGILLLPTVLYQDSLRYFSLFNDDFSYTARSLNASTFMQHWLAPHNTHVVPLFRAWTLALIQLAGSKGAWLTAFAIGTFVPLAVGMLAMGHLVARESGSIAVGLAAMGLLGITTTLESVLTWYAAGQALWAGAMVVVALVGAQAWRARGRAAALVITILACVAAPLFWTGGLAAMAAVAAYLWADARLRCRRAAIGFVTLLGVAGGAIVLLAQRNLAQASIVWEERRELLPRPIQALLHVCQAIPEALVAGNLGLDVVTTQGQGFVLTLALVASWFCWARRQGGASPLSIAGAATVVAGALVVYAFRGNLPYNSLRDLGWYHAVPHIGFVMFAAGIVGRREAVERSRLRWPTWASTLAVIGICAALYLLHAARYERHIIQGAPPLSDSEKTRFPIPELQYLRARYFMEDHAARQRRALARLDRAQEVASRAGLSRETLRRGFGIVLIPGMLRRNTPNNAFELLAIPETGWAELDARTRGVLAGLFVQEPEPRPPWLEKSDAWPPAEEYSRWIGGD
jgi:hypothetical protein